ncbi:hypothetical protein NHX12_030150 [Muraenolepis orangiensis]|uniref:Uncharacterized protein n=1 Tax=Muraenolepis orangiensis TaxID=630683 RepID=A0A9Q0ILF4_9TELE|nr:hypothetical protein NHX12_030150 [Muraenolepis orangiensis]
MPLGESAGRTEVPLDPLGGPRPPWTRWEDRGPPGPAGRTEVPLDPLGGPRPPWTRWEDRGPPGPAGRTEVPLDPLGGPRSPWTRWEDRGPPGPAGRTEVPEPDSCRSSDSCSRRPAAPYSFIVNEGAEEREVTGESETDPRAVSCVFPSFLVKLGQRAGPTSLALGPVTSQQ